MGPYGLERPINEVNHLCQDTARAIDQTGSSIPQG
jgi:hypothetical protein